MSLRLFDEVVQVFFEKFDEVVVEVFAEKVC